MRAAGLCSDSNVYLKKVKGGKRIIQSNMGEIQMSTPKKLFELFCWKQKEQIFEAGKLFFEIHSGVMDRKNEETWLEKMPF